MNSASAPMGDLPGRATAVAHPSLALVKYWGKDPAGVNIPATGSIGVTLGALTTTTTVTITAASITAASITAESVTAGSITAGSDNSGTSGAGRTDSPAETPGDQIVINGTLQDPGPFRPVLDTLRREIVIRRNQDGSRGNGPVNGPNAFTFLVESENNFPTAAGLASSASGFAALVTAAFAAAGLPGVSASERSGIARIGSGSAARSVHGGFVVWHAGASRAEELYHHNWWPELRVVVLPLSGDRKPVSSRSGMNHTRDTSPFYNAWVEDAPILLEKCRRAVEERSLDALGPVMRASYMRMFATMLGADPPILYWLPATLEVLHRLEALRSEGLPVWETMDAGPQVKVITTADCCDAVVSEFRPICAAEPVVSPVGGAARVEGTEQ